MRKRGIFIVSFYFLFVFIATGQGNLSYPDINYSGQRVFLETLEIEQGKKGKSKFTAKLINTGKEIISNHFFSNQTVLLNTHQQIVSSIGQNGLAEVYHSLSLEKWNLAAGKSTSLTFKLVKNNSKSNDVNEELAKIPTPTESKSESSSVEIEEQEIIIETKSAEVKETVETDVKVEIEEKINKEEILQKEKIESLENEKIEIKKEEEVLIEAELPENSENNIGENDPQVERKKCSDLVIEKLEIIKQTKKAATIRYTIINHGEGHAQLSSENKNEQNLAVRAFLSSSNKLSRGAITLGGETLKLNEDQEKLKSGEQYIGTIRLPLYKLTKFTPYVVLQVDPYQQLIECDETNNVNTINLMDGASTSQN